MQQASGSEDTAGGGRRFRTSMHALARARTHSAVRSRVSTHTHTHTHTHTCICESSIQATASIYTNVCTLVHCACAQGAQGHKRLRRLTLHLPRSGPRSSRCIAPGEACGPRTHARSHWSSPWSQHTRVHHAARRRAWPRLARLAVGSASMDSFKIRKKIPKKKQIHQSCAECERVLPVRPSEVGCELPRAMGMKRQNEAPA